MFQTDTERYKIMNLIYEHEILDREIILDAIAEANNQRNWADVQILEKFDKDCIDTWGDAWVEDSLNIMSDNAMVEYAWEILEDSDSGVSRKMLGYIDIDKFVRDLKYDYVCVTLMDYDFWGLSYV